MADHAVFEIRGHWWLLGCGRRYSTERATTITSPRRSRVLAAVIGISVFGTIIAHNAATYETFEPTKENPTHGTIEYGWPVSCFRGFIDVEGMFSATEARQHWAATTGGSVVAVGLILNASIAVLLAYTTYNALLWTINSFNAKLSIATLLGLLAFMALLFAFEVADNAELYEMFPRLRGLFVETLAWQYIEKTVWLTLFIACLWLPNRLAQLGWNREKAGNG